MEASVQQGIEKEALLRLDDAGIDLLAVLLDQRLAGRRIELALAAAAGEPERRAESDKGEDGQRIARHGRAPVEPAPLNMRRSRARHAGSRGVRAFVRLRQRLQPALRLRPDIAGRRAAIARAAPDRAG